MSAAAMKYREIRFVIEEELTQVYVLLEALGDCPIGVQGWHHKTYPSSKSVKDIVPDIADAVMWGQEAPEPWKK